MNRETVGPDGHGLTLTMNDVSSSQEKRMTKTTMMMFDRFPWTLQHYEKVVLSLLRDDVNDEEERRSFPRYVREVEKKETFWNKVPMPCHPAVPPKRLKRKRWQLESMIGFAMSVILESKTRPRRVLDLCGGTGQIVSFFFLV